MSKKHFVSIAAALLHAKPLHPACWHARKQWKEDAEQITLALATTNPHFDKARFLKAAGVEA